MDEYKKSPEEEKDKETPENPEQEKPEGEKEEQKPEEKPKDEKPEEKAPDDKQADENGEGADKPEEKADNPEEKTDEAAADPKDEEILKLKTQIAAMQMGFNPECMEDAVVLAESYVKSGAQKDINTALSAVMKKYPDWKAEGGKSDGKKQGGFRVGAGGTDKQESADNDKLSKAFGIKKKK
jgi:outer membrane biosynthesis protein TonB